MTLASGIGSCPADQSVLQALAKNFQPEAWWSCSKLQLCLGLSSEMAQLILDDKAAECVRRVLLWMLIFMEVPLLQFQQDCRPGTNPHWWCRPSKRAREDEGRPERRRERDLL